MSEASSEIIEQVDPINTRCRRRPPRLLTMLILAVLAAAIARKLALANADRQFEERLAALDDSLS